MAMSPSRALNALQILHYVAPVAVVIYFLTSTAIAACLLQQPSTQVQKPSRRYSVVALLVAVVLSFTAQAIGYGLQSAQQQRYSATQDSIVYVILSIFVYLLLTLQLLEKKNPLWHTYLGAFSVGLAAEVPCLVLQALTEPLEGDFVISRVALHVFRALILLVLCFTGSFILLSSRARKASKDHETEPLLGNRANGNLKGADGHIVTSLEDPKYGATDAEGHEGEDPDHADHPDSDFDSDSEEPELDAEVKRQQQKRLQESGSWINYVKDFKIFIPILWPSRNRFLQTCLAIVGAVIIAERFLNVLVPRQIGIITDELAAGYAKGIIPWRAVGTWMLLVWLRSQAGLALVKALAELPVQQFAYKSIGVTAFRHIMGLSMNFHSEKSSGELIRAIDQGQRLTGLLEFVFFELGPMFLDLLIAFFYVYSLFDIYMSLILLVIGTAYVWIGAKTTAWSVKRRRRLNSAWRSEAKVQNEAINNWSTVSHFNQGEHESERYSRSVDEYNTAEWYYDLAFYFGGSAQSVVMLLGRLAATLLAVYRVAQGQAPVGHFVTLTTYWVSIESPLSRVSWSIRRVSQMLTDSERLLQLLKTEATVTDQPGATELVISKGRIEFDQVAFAYDVRRPTLKEVSFTAQPGQTVALVGETGGGKSTILKLLYRYYDISGGAIRIDGQDIREITLDSLRDSFGMVPQDPALFNETIMANIKYARLDATDEEVKDACRAAAIHDKIESFPGKYKATVGERGVKLSGGELQRIAIARAILRQPKIVLLDEATSMIDAETEDLIQQAFKKLTRGRTTFIVAHRLSTIQHADQILVINDGQIVERGTHAELFRRNGKYVALWSKQLSKDVQEIGTALNVNRDDRVLIDLAEESAPLPPPSGQRSESSETD